MYETFAAACTTTGKICLNSLPNHTGSQGNGMITTVLQIAIGIIAAIALLFIVIGGTRYIFSQGDANAVGKAKNTIVFALVGLVIAIFAQVIVVYVVRRVT